MSSVRSVAALVGFVLLGGGWLASAYAFFFGDVAAYSRAVEDSAIPLLATGLLLVAVVLGFTRSEQGGDA
ncbi:MAG: hypothetical protein KIT11_11020 [Fimbriimonadaceae bacterium]|nr:hypothetical protein [Fimbriimonadaceae bacterium]QYK55852.1 MAG: hypothetical protein KF733_12690 [Fimbriimonadaceae bacterium]